MHTLFPKEVYFIHSKYSTFLTLTSPYNTLLIKIPILEEESSQVILQVGRELSKVLFLVLGHTAMERKTSYSGHVEGL